MPMFSNARWERFAQALAAGKTADEAYEAAGYKPDRGHASRLASNGNIQARVAEILGRAAERVEISRAKVLAELAKIGFANMADYMRHGPDGDPYLDFSALSRDQAAALSEVTVEDFKDGRGKEARDVRRVKFKLADKRAALVDIAKIEGWVIERQEHGQPGDFDSLNDDELRDFVFREVEALGAGGPGTEAAGPEGKTNGTGRLN